MSRLEDEHMLSGKIPDHHKVEQHIGNSNQILKKGKPTECYN